MTKLCERARKYSLHVLKFANMAMALSLRLSFSKLSKQLVAADVQFQNTRLFFTKRMARRSLQDQERAKYTQDLRTLSKSTVNKTLTWDQQTFQHLLKSYELFPCFILWVRVKFAARAVHSYDIKIHCADDSRLFLERYGKSHSLRNGWSIADRVDQGQDRFCSQTPVGVCNELTNYILNIQLN